MDEGHLQKLITSVQTRLVLWISFLGFILLGADYLLETVFHLNSMSIAVTLLVLWFVCALITGIVLGRYVTKPLEFIAQAILHISPSEHLTPAPNLDKLKLGHELASVLTRQVYDFAAVTQHAPKSDDLPTGILDQLPVAVLGISQDGLISLANNKAKSTMQIETLTGVPLKDTLYFLSEDEISIDSWLKNASENSLTGLRLWQKVEVKNLNGVSLGYFDIAISYSKHSATGIEAIVTFYDHSEAYNEEAASISFLALAVHELRSPLTILRGYIDAFEDELGPNISPQIADDLRKMNASAVGLTSFVSNILNVARINQGQLSLNLEEDNWNVVLPQVIDNLRSRAAVYDKQIELRMEPNLPSVAIDRTTIGEVVTNLIDNAIKYTPNNNDNIVVISRINPDGLIETTVQDHGVGIPEAVISNLFHKFYRNHRNRNQIGGTGLGLFLSKSIVSAHNGNIWVKSKENEGSTFGFTLLPFAQLAKELQSNNNEAIVRSSHGWIKNHSMQRR